MSSSSTTPSGPIEAGAPVSESFANEWSTGIDVP